MTKPKLIRLKWQIVNLEGEFCILTIKKLLKNHKGETYSLLGIDFSISIVGYYEEFFFLRGLF